MNNKLTKWIRVYYERIINSIAFYPAVISIGFLLLSWIMLTLDFSDIGKTIKSQISWISLKDASTARTILSTIAASILSLTVFSFSMVMIVLNQAASQVSNRAVDSMVANRVQQIILGFYIGTIVYALFLLSTIRDIQSGIYVPALSIYLLILLTVMDVFFFIYFLHYVTQSIQYENIIQRIHHRTLKAMKKLFIRDAPMVFEPDAAEQHLLYTPESGYFQGFHEKILAAIAAEQNVVLQFLLPQGTYLLKGVPLVKVYGSKKLSGQCVEDIWNTIDFYSGQPIDRNPFYGFHHLAEVAIKALSPGINDPETAVLSLNMLADLFAFHLTHYPQIVYKDDQDRVRIIAKNLSFTELFKECIFPIWHYGQQDPYVQDALTALINQLKLLDEKEQFAAEFNLMLMKVKKEQV